LNIIDSNLVGLGAAASSNYGATMIDNDWYNNGTDISNLPNVSKGDGATADDPGYTPPDYTPTTLTDITLVTGAIIQQGAVPAAGAAGVQVGYVG
jgi:hypothetical protein